MKSIAESLIEEGMQKGMQQGMRQGMQQGEQRTLLKILYRRFKKVPPKIDKQIRSASLEQIEAWIDLALDANSIDEVFPEN